MLMHNIIDIDECFEAALLSTNLCESDPNSQCVNSAGTFECVCVSGYTRNENGTCESKISAFFYFAISNEASNNYFKF